VEAAAAVGQAMLGQGEAGRGGGALCNAAMVLASLRIQREGLAF
jgi:hypothetical protein